MGCFVDDHYEANVVVQRSLQEVWKALQEQRDGELIWLSVWPRMPGFESAGTVLSIEPMQSIQVYKDAEPCKDSEIILTLRAEGTGTHIQVIQKNVPDWVKASIDASRHPRATPRPDAAMASRRDWTCAKKSPAPIAWPRRSGPASTRPRTVI